MLDIRSVLSDPRSYLAVPRFEIAPDQLARQKPDDLLVASSAGSVLARCGLWFRQTPPYPGERLGLIGHYFAASLEAGTTLLGAACRRLAEKGCTLAAGPMDGNTWQRYRLVTERGSEPPFFLEPDNPDDWPEHFVRAGFAPLAQYYSALAERLDVHDPRCEETGPRLAERGIHLRPLDLAHFEDELRRLHELSLASFASNFLYTPIAEEDFLAQYAPVRPFLRPELVLLAEQAGRLVGFIFAVPDLLQQKRGERIDTVVVKTMAVHPDLQGIGLGGHLMDRIHQAVNACGYRRAVHALFHDANRSGAISRHSARVIRRYTLFAPAGGDSLMNLARILQEQVRIRPGAAALVERSWGRTRTTTFADLEHLSSRAAGLFLKAGLRRGDVVLVLQPMSAELYVALMAVFRLGMVVMALDPSAGLSHIERCCALQGPRGFIASSKAHLLRLVSPALRRIPVQIAIGCPVPFATRWARLSGTKPHPDIAPVEGDSPALLTFTSGSTGQPKGAIRTHGFLLAQHAALAHSLSLTPGDIDVATLPIVLLANLASGVTSLIPDCDLRRPGFIAPAPVVRQMQEHGATSSVASPAFFECLARYCIERRITLPSLRKLFTGGAPVFPRLLEQMQRMAPNADVVALYGSTEAEPIAHLSRRELTAGDKQAMLSGSGLLAGPPVPEVSLRILRDSWGRPVGPFTPAEFDAQCCAANEPGEIVVTGGHVLKGYLNGVGDEETKFRAGETIWHRTGDAGYLDERGRLWLLGRCVGRIDDTRGRLYPFAAETAAYQDSRVKRAAVVAHEGKRLLVVEWYDSREPGDPESLRRGLHWAGIDEVRIWKRIPVDNRHNAKIDYLALFRELRSHGNRSDT